MHPTKILAKQNLTQFSEELLKFIEYLDQYHSKSGEVLLTNWLVRFFWRPEQGWPTILAQYPQEIKLCEELASILRKFIAEPPELSAIELILELNHFIEALPDNSPYFIAPGLKEPLGGVEDIVEVGKVILATKVPDKMTEAMLDQELQMSLNSIKAHRAVIEHNSSNTTEEQLRTSSQSEQALDELLSLQASVEKHICKSHLVQNLTESLHLDVAITKEITTALENKQFESVRLRLNYLRDKLSANSSFGIEQPLTTKPVPTSTPKM